jgi:hypothetical protein
MNKFLWDEQIEYVFDVLEISEEQQYSTEMKLLIEFKFRFGFDCIPTCWICLRVWMMEEAEYLFS